MLDLGQKAEKQQAGPQTALGWGETWASASEDSQVLPRDPRDFLEGGVWEVSLEKMLGIQDTAGTVEPK